MFGQEPASVVERPVRGDAEAAVSVAAGMKRNSGKVPVASSGAKPVSSMRTTLHHAAAAVALDQGRPSRPRRG